MEFSRFVKWFMAFVFITSGFALVIMPERFDERVVTTVVGCIMAIIGLSSIPRSEEDECDEEVINTASS